MDLKNQITYEIAQTNKILLTTYKMDYQPKRIKTDSDNR